MRHRDVPLSAVPLPRKRGRRDVRGPVEKFAAGHGLIDGGDGVEDREKANYTRME
ncbi:hypothetical protein J6590_017562 [Homalodisca vitripennis]|nr:hypothetical protein J6590_017562 [Homalodisca vitripennis]